MHTAHLYTTFKKLGIVTPEEVPIEITSTLIDHGFALADSKLSPRTVVAEVSRLANTSSSETEFETRLNQAGLLVTVQGTKPRNTAAQDGCLVPETGTCVPSGG